jgi:hypothetical protein
VRYSPAMTTTSAAPGNALIFIPGTLFWVLVIAGAVTGSNLLIGGAVALAVVTIVGVLVMRGKAAAREDAARAELWQHGTPTRARVVDLKTTGTRINQSPEVDLELEVTLPDQAPYRVTVRRYISVLSVPRVQPDCMLDVRVDPNDRTKVAIDPALR